MKSHICFSYLLISFFAVLSSCSTNPITSENYVERPFSMVASGTDSGANSRLLLVSYNRFFNEDFLGKEKVSQLRLDTINFRKSMLVEIFMPQSFNNAGLNIDKVEENVKDIRLYYSFDLNSENDGNYAPFIIAEISKSRKEVRFFENGREVTEPNQNIYLNN